MVNTAIFHQSGISIIASMGCDAPGKDIQTFRRGGEAVTTSVESVAVVVLQRVECYCRTSTVRFTTRSHGGKCHIISLRTCINNLKTKQQILSKMETDCQNTSYKALFSEQLIFIHCAVLTNFTMPFS